MASVQSRKAPIAKPQDSRIWRSLKAVGGFSSLKTKIAELLNGKHSETATEVLSESWKAALLKCAVHFLPVSATIALAYFNLAGFFIGGELQGYVGPTWQALDRLCLQVTAKLIELLIIASLGVMVMDVVRDKLLFGSEGVPFGLVLAKLHFGDLTYLLSREFRAGLLGFRSHRTRLLFALLIITCSLVALFAGPSAALLLIPSYYTAWPAGGASFWMNGDLFPSTMDSTSSKCQSWQQNTSFISSPDFGAVSCPWAGYPYLATAFQQQAYIPEANVLYDIGPFQQNIRFTWGGGGARVQTVGSNLAITAFSRYLGWGGWYRALFGAPQTQQGGLDYNLHYRVYNGTQGSVQTKLPVVRTQCFPVVDLMPSASMAASTPPGKTLLPFPVVSGFYGDLTLRYFLPVTLLNTSQLATQWVPIPQGLSENSFGPPTGEYPSAFLLIQNPGTIDNTASAITCSVLANWMPGFNIAGGIAWGNLQSAQAEGVPADGRTLTMLNEWLFPVAPLPSDTPAFDSPKQWQQVTLTDGWLNALTPSLNANVSGWNTMASVLESVLGPSLASNLPAILSPADLTDNVFTSINAIVGSFIADGMSRTGWDENNCDYLSNDYVFNSNNAGDSDCYWQWNQDSWPDVDKSIIAGKATFMPCTDHPASDIGAMYQWTANVEGYGLKANSAAYYLALAVLFMHLLLVVLHIAWTLVRRRTSSAWSSITDLFALGLLSDPPEEDMKDTSSGIDTNRTLKLQLRIRDLPKVPVGHEHLHLLVQQSDGREVEDGVKYGAQH